MAINFPGPYEVRIQYTVEELIHFARYNLTLTTIPDVGEEFDTLTAVMRNGGGKSLDTAVDELVTVLTPFHSAADATIDSAELWAYEPFSFESTFVSSYAIGEVGESANPHTPASQRTYTFRTQEGGIMRVVLLETPLANAGFVTPYASLTLANKDLMDLFAADTNVWLARDTSYPVVPLRLLTGQNEKTFRQRFRP